MDRPTEPRLQPIPAVAERAREAMRDLPVNAVNVMATLAHNPAVSKAVNRLAQTAVTLEGGLSRRHVELAVLRMGWNCRSEYEFGQHTLFGRDAGLSDAEIYAATRPIDEGPWTSADAVVLQMVDDLYADDCISDSSWDAGVEHFGPPDIVQLIAVAGCYRLLSSFLNSVGVERDEGVPGWPSPPGT